MRPRREVLRGRGPTSTDPHVHIVPCGGHIETEASPVIRYGCRLSPDQILAVSGHSIQEAHGVVVRILREGDGGTPDRIRSCGLRLRRPPYVGRKCLVDNDLRRRVSAFAARFAVALRGMGLSVVRRVVRAADAVIARRASVLWACRGLCWAIYVVYMKYFMDKMATSR